VESEDKCIAALEAVAKQRLLKKQIEKNYCSVE
jgi:hypothetical protein